jgi:hypothetical protein
MCDCFNDNHTPLPGLAAVGHKLYMEDSSPEVPVAGNIYTQTAVAWSDQIKKNALEHWKRQLN